nr:MAG TPA: holin [Caudoviricetes sp.]
MLPLLLTAKVPQLSEQDPDGILHVLNIIRRFYGYYVDEHLIILGLLFVIVFDIILGTSNAWVYHEYKSYKFRRGLVSHAAMFFLTALLYPFIVLAGLDKAIDAFVITMVFAYSSSILANLAKLGVNIPYIDQYVRTHIDSHKFELKDTDTPEDIQRKLGHSGGKEKNKNRRKSK